MFKKILAVIVIVATLMVALAPTAAAQEEELSLPEVAQLIATDLADGDAELASDIEPALCQFLESLFDHLGCEIQKLHLDPTQSYWLFVYIELWMIYDVDLDTMRNLTSYYDPEVGRWISPDDGIDLGAGFVGYNMYAYCANNPVNYADITGESIILTCILIGVVVGVVAGGAGGAYYSYKKFGKVKWEYVVGGAVVGGVIGGLVGWGAGALIQAFSVATAATSITSGGGAGFYTFQKLKDFLGPAGLGKVWHHIVEQCQAWRSGFSDFWIQNSNNVINITTKIHNKISAFYSSIPDPTIVDTGGKIFRDWLSGMGFEQQYEWGIWVLRLFGVDV